jgi:di/tricarboxylate transporter
MVVIGLLSPQEARDAIDWSLYVAIASAFGISTSLTNSGVAEAVASFLITIGDAFGIGGESAVACLFDFEGTILWTQPFPPSRLELTDAGIFGAVYFATALISSFVTNNAAAALMFPIAIGAANTSGINLKLMSYCLMLGASDFSTPFGYQTNLMVYGPGGYKVRLISARLACIMFQSLTLRL